MLNHISSKLQGINILHGVLAGYNALFFRAGIMTASGRSTTARHSVEFPRGPELSSVLGFELAARGDVGSAAVRLRGEPESYVF